MHALGTQVGLSAKSSPGSFLLPKHVSRVTDCNLIGAVAA